MCGPNSGTASTSETLFRWLPTGKSLPYQYDSAAVHGPRCTPTLKVTAPTGIRVVAANIWHGSRIFSLLSLPFHMLTGPLGGLRWIR